MNSKVTFARSASDDVVAAVTYIANDLCNVPAAQRLLNAIDGIVATISRFPEAYPLCTDQKLRAMNVRHAKVEGYVLFYISSSETNTVTVIAFIHGTRDYANYLISCFD